MKKEKQKGVKPTVKSLTKQVKALAKKSEPKKDSKLMWAGGSKLLEKSESKEVQKQKNAILVMSNVLGVSPFGVNILGGVAYINKLGRKQKLRQYGGGKWAVEYNWVQRALNDTDKAICEARVIDRETRQPLGEWAVGECSPASMKMSTLAGYQNHNAQTRAHNRAIEECLGAEIHEEMLENLGKLQMSKDQKLPMLETGVSIEEMNVGGNQPKQKSDDIELPEAECHECGNPMTKQEATYSMKIYKRNLCRQCQAQVKKMQ